VQDTAPQHLRIAKTVLRRCRGDPRFRRMSDRTREPATPSEDPPKPAMPAPLPKEIGGPPGPEPTRYGDWEYKGRCVDF
jgi:hypothetical protein